MNLAVMVELPLVVIDVQRAGPSTGMPTKNEQADLLQAMFGRNGDSPVPIVAPATPGECFDLAFEAVRLALQFMTPVVYLSDAFLATGSEPWLIPDLDDLPDIAVPNRTERSGFQPYARDPDDPGPALGGPRHARARAPHRRSREGRHHRQRELRPGQPPPDAAAAPEKIARIADDIPELEVFGPDRGDLLILGWGSTYGAIRSAVERLQARGPERRPRPPSLPQPVPGATPATSSGRYKRVLVPEVNLGQLLLLVRARYLIDAVGYNRVRGKPFRITEIEQRPTALLDALETDAMTDRADGRAAADPARPLSPENAGRSSS